jgi:hypothetical protein
MEGEKIIVIRYIIVFTALMLLSANALHAQNETVQPFIQQDTSASGAVLVPVPTEKAMDYYNSGNILWVVDTLWGILIPALFLFTGFSAKIRNWAQKLGKKWFLVIGIYFLLFSIVMFVVGILVRTLARQPSGAWR